jgi:hypothetical protein
MLELLAQRLGSGLLWVAAGTIVFTVVFGDLPGEGLYVAVLQNSCHAPAFATLSLITLILLARRGYGADGAPGPGVHSTVRVALVRAVTTVVAMGCLGVATEGIQSLFGRDAELDDVVSDVVGSLGAAGLWTYAHLWKRTERGARITRIMALLACAGALAYWLEPLVECADAYWHRHSQFPVLAQFHSQRDLYFIEGDLANLRIAPTAAGQGNIGTALEVSLGSGRWPGVTFSEPMPDWRGHATLALDLSNPGETAVSLHLRVNDHGHTGDFDDRFNTSLLLPPRKRTTIAIPLERIALAPAARRMNLKRIATVILFHDGAAPGQVFLVHRIWLE